MSFEVVVRPAVFPNIRPAPARSLPPLDDPDQGFAVIRGQGAKQISVSNSASASGSTSNRKETKRRVDEARVYQKEDDGTVNKDNFIDIEVPDKIWMKGPAEPTPEGGGGGPTAPGEPEPTRESMNRVTIDYYRPIQEAENIEIKKKRVIKRTGEVWQE